MSYVFFLEIYRKSFMIPGIPNHRKLSVIAIEIGNLISDKVLSFAAYIKKQKNVISVAINWGLLKNT